MPIGLKTSSLVNHPSSTSSYLVVGGGGVVSGQNKKIG